VLCRQIQNRQNSAEKKKQIKIEDQTTSVSGHHTPIKRADKTPTQTNDNTSKKNCTELILSLTLSPKPSFAPVKTLAGKTASEMTYNVSSGTLNPTQLNST